ncbi:hypothetical protein OGM63_13530 [Plectonema radiosum NIES-515]|uniref:Uncharacterized protein n=1 Tax=Plectonema radiosum NIES-515 TaxID=2986073 RepID=A0ABT3AZI1_9CYAN|nr:hypothetical protein [Plectonema radiosum]MCV3214521.1 hypothetical protein [Plectonema radiosum NIES-515]
MNPEENHPAHLLAKITSLSEQLSETITAYRTHCAEDYQLTNQETYSITDLSLEDLRAILDYLAKF